MSKLSHWCVLQRLVALAAVVLSSAAGAAEQYGGAGGRQYAELVEIAPENVDELKVAWRARTGDLNQGYARKNHSLQTHPIYWNGLLYVSTSSGSVVAMDAGSGEQRWRFDSRLPLDLDYAESASRGVSLWHRGDSGYCADRIFLGTLVGHLYALDAVTGEPCADFANRGRLDLTTGIGNVRPGEYAITSPPAVIGDLLVVGSAIGDNGATDLERGIVRAVDAGSGEVIWSWDPIPVSAEQSHYGTWENDSAPKTGAANAWPPLTADNELGRVYVSTGSPSPDFYGGERLGANLHANSLVALDVESGEVIWAQQLVHHDVWDYDIPSQPTLTRINLRGEDVAAVAVVTKTGMLYAFNRRTGEPVYELTENPVPETDVAGERVSPTQPFSAFPALVDHGPLTSDDAFGLTWFDKRSCTRVLESYRSEGIFTPPSITGTIMSPSYVGGANWGGIAIDEARQIAVVNANTIPALVKLIPRSDVAALIDRGELEGWEIGRQGGTPYVMARRIFLSALGLPCTKPPWNNLLALDLRNQEILWNVPLGTIRDLAPGIVPNFEWGAPGIGGPLITASGLVVIGATSEFALHFFDLESGVQLRKLDLPTAAMATPMSYEHEGKQYIAIAVGGHDNLDMPRGDYIYAFALEDD